MICKGMEEPKFEKSSQVHKKIIANSGCVWDAFGMRSQAQVQNFLRNYGLQKLWVVSVRGTKAVRSGCVSDAFSSAIPLSTLSFSCIPDAFLSRGIDFSNFLGAFRSIPGAFLSHI